MAYGVFFRGTKTAYIRYKVANVGPSEKPEECSVYVPHMIEVSARKDLSAAMAEGIVMAAGGLSCRTLGNASGEESPASSFCTGGWYASTPSAMPLRVCRLPHRSCREVRG